MSGNGIQYNRNRLNDIHDYSIYIIITNELINNLNMSKWFDKNNTFNL